MKPLDINLIVSESSLFEIYVKWRKTRERRFNAIASLVPFAMLLVYSTVLVEGRSDIVARIRDISEFGFSFSVSILSILIAGFAIYAVSNDKTMFVVMSMVPYKKSDDISYFKYIFFAFVHVFVLYLFACFIFLAIKIFACPKCFLSLLVREIPKEHLDIILFYCCGLVYALLGGFLFYILLGLKSFVYNIYHILTVSVVFEWKSKTKEAKNDILEMINLSSDVGEPTPTPPSGDTPDYPA